MGHEAAGWKLVQKNLAWQLQRFQKIGGGKYELPPTNGKYPLRTRFETVETGVELFQKQMKKPLITVAVTILFWMVIAKAVTGCYTAICKGY